MISRNVSRVWCERSIAALLPILAVGCSGSSDGAGSRPLGTTGGAGAGGVPGATGGGGAVSSAGGIISSAGGLVSTGGSAVSSGGSVAAGGSSGGSSGTTGGTSTASGGTPTGGSTPATGGSSGGSGPSGGMAGSMGGSTGGAAPGGSSGGGGAPGTGGAGGQSGVLLDEDFEGFDPQGWIVDHDNDPLDDDKVGNWAVIVDPGNPQNHIYQQQTEYSDDSWAVGGNVNWTDQILEVRVKLVSASHSDDVLVTLAGRLALSDTDPGRDDPNYYFVYLRGDGSLRMRKRVDGSTDDLFSTVHLDDPIQLGTWHTLRLSIQGTSLSASLDGEVMGTATDSELTHGGVGLMVVDGVAAFDDLSVTLP